MPWPVKGSRRNATRVGSSFVRYFMCGWPTWLHVVSPPTPHCAASMISVVSPWATISVDFHVPGARR
ncbi:hypothetical protein P0F65_16280 [Sphingomonas sp. I4]